MVSPIAGLIAFRPEEFFSDAVSVRIPMSGLTISSVETLNKLKANVTCINSAEVALSGQEGQKL